MVEEESLITNNKKAQLVHFSKINIFGDSGVGKTSLISHMENYANKNFKIVDDTNNSDDSKSSDSLNLSLGYVEQIKRIVIEYNDDRNLYFNVYETNLNRYDSIKMNLETILFQTECIIILWDNSKPETFDNISNFITTIE
jgi:GTPase SAR1 family protein